MDARRVTDMLKAERIDTFISSPYNRGYANDRESANFHEKEIVVYENLKECMFSSEDQVISDKRGVSTCTEDVL